MLVSTPSASHWTLVCPPCAFFSRFPVFNFAAQPLAVHCAIFKVPYVGKFSLIKRLRSQITVQTVQIHMKMNKN